jgi:hypothetical protein
VRRLLERSPPRRARSDHLCQWRGFCPIGGGRYRDKGWASLCAGGGSRRPRCRRSGVHGAVELLSGRLDILVNNAGIAQHGPIGGLPDAVFERHVDVNIRGLGTRLQRQWRCFRTVVGSSISAASSANACPSRGERLWSVEPCGRRHDAGWTRDLAPRAITVNTVQPGPIATEANPAEGERAERIKAMVRSAASAVRTRSVNWSPSSRRRRRPTSPAPTSRSTAGCSPEKAAAEPDQLSCCRFDGHRDKLFRLPPPDAQSR